MLQVRPSAGTVGRTRTCPHCKATILESAAVCPQCRHHLRFGVADVAQPNTEGFSALRVEGSIWSSVNCSKETMKKVLFLTSGPLSVAP